MKRLILTVIGVLAFGELAQAEILCPSGSIELNQDSEMSGELYQGAENIRLEPFKKTQLCLKVRERSDYLLVPYHTIVISGDMMPKFSGSGLNLREMPLVKSISKGYFENEIVLIDVTLTPASPSKCNQYPNPCLSDLYLNIYWKGFRGEDPTVKFCKDGFLPPYYNPITVSYTPGFQGIRQVPLSPDQATSYCTFNSKKSGPFKLYIADRTGPAQCGTHFAKYTPPKGSLEKTKFINNSALVNTNAVFGSYKSPAPRGIYRIKARIVEEKNNCSNKMEINSY